MAGGGAIGAAVGLAILLSAILRVGPAVPDINPILSDPESIAAGRLRFDEDCAGCHGSGGCGDGPLASPLNPPPLDLAVHVPLHPDGALFSFIKWGVEGTAMPSFAERLEDEQIWHIVNFIQTIRP